MTDSALFVSGALFTLDYLSEGILKAPQYGAVDVVGIRERLKVFLAGFPHASLPNEATTEKDFVWPVLALLDWQVFLTQQNLSASRREDVPDGLLFIDAEAKAKANTHPEEWKRYNFGAAVVEAKRWKRALDRAEGRKGDDKETPSTQMLRYLRRIDDLTNGSLRWGILTNGGKWRLYFSGARSTIDDYLEIDLARILGLEADLLDSGVTDAERDHWLRVFVAMFSRSAFIRPAIGAQSYHDQARAEAAFYEERVAKSLSELVFGQLYPALAKGIAQAATPATSLEDIRQATLILLYRLLFILYAEDRDLLPVRDSRYQDYAMRQTRLEVGKRKDEGHIFSGVAKNIWNRFSDLAEMIDKGDASVGLPPYNGGLFSAEQTPLLKSIALPDAVMAEALDILSWEKREGRRFYINYRDLSVQQLGSIYERLLEFELVRDVAGGVEIRPNIFARKNSGSYYTPDELVLLILDETLAPLVDDAYRAFHEALDNLNSALSEDERLDLLHKVDPALAITRLRVCDPAMGSGHFLVSLVDRLTNHALAAMAEASVLARGEAGLDYDSPVAEEIRKIRSTIKGNARDAGWSVADEQLDDPQLVKRMVLKRCVYGADKNPMAVELAKVSLWLHTFTVGAPLSFIDHHLAAGDSLFGLWVRDAIDKARTGGELLYIKELRNAERQAATMQRIEALTDAEIAEAHHSAEMWRDVEYQTGPFDGFVSFMNALDWLDLSRAQKVLVTQWLDGNFGDPLPIACGYKEPEAKRSGQGKEAEAFRAIWQAARELIAEERFLNWQITFPGVWRNWSAKERDGGFDAIVGNPPWDRIKLQQVEWFAARRPKIAAQARASDRERLVEELISAADPLADDFIRAETRANAALRMARLSSGKPSKDPETGKKVPAPSDHYPLLSHGDINLYSLFVERAHSLVKPDGMVGLLVPIGIGADKTSAKYISTITGNRQLKAFMAFENRRRWLFKDVHAEDQPTILVASNCGRHYPKFRYAVKLHALPSEQFDPTVMMDAHTLEAVNPNTGTVPIFRSAEDARIVSAIYARTPVFVRKSGQGNHCDWSTRYVTMFHMTNESALFQNKHELENVESAWPIGQQRFQSAKGIWLPLYEGKSVQIYNHRYASIITPEGSISGQGQAIHSTPDELASPNFYPTPRYWVNVCEVNAITRGYAIGFNDVCNTNNARSLIAAIVPQVAAGNKLPLLDDLDARESALLIGNLNSIPCDYLARNKIQSRNLNKYILEQLPIIPPSAYTREFGPKTAAAIVREGVLELTYTAHDMVHFARDMGYVDTKGDVHPPFSWDEERRLKLRAKLDALYFILYGVFNPASPEQSRSDIRYIYSTFPIVEREETTCWGRYRSRDLALSWINALMAGQPSAEVAG